jgi:hypothetical protein
MKNLKKIFVFGEIQNGESKAEIPQRCQPRDQVLHFHLDQKGLL